MAEATKAKRTIVEETVTLKISTDEAETLLAIFSKIGGDESATPYKHVKAMAAALIKAGVRDYTTEDHPYQNLVGGSSLIFTAKKSPWRWGYLNFTSTGRYGLPERKRDAARAYPEY